MDQRQCSYYHHHSILQNTTPHDLIVRVGGKGPYQDNIFYLTIALWYIAGIIIFQGPFLFLGAEFQFPQGQQNTDICTIQQNLQRNFYLPNTIKSINTQYGPFICQYIFLLGIIKSVIYFGALVGYLLFTTYMDKFGRRGALVITSACICIGSLILSFSSDILWIGVGLFFLGIGRTVTRATILIINQICDQSMRQRGSVVLQAYQGLSGFTIVIGYYLIRDWRIFNFLTVLIPSIIVFIIIIYYVQQTPTFLLLKQQSEVLRALNRIGKINLKIDNVLQKQDIDNFYSQSNLKRMKKQLQFKHMFTLPSLKTKVYGLCMIYFANSFLYYAPIFIINQMSVGIYVSMTALSVVQFVGFFTMLVIQKTPRRSTGIYIYMLSSFLTGILIFIKVPEECAQGGCFYSYLQLFCVFLSRLICTFYLTILTLYGNQLFPTKARGMCLGFNSTIGAISTTLVNIIIGFCLKHDINIMIVFTLSALISVYGISFLPQTLNQPLQDQIQEFKKSRMISNNSQGLQMKRVQRK